MMFDIVTGFGKGKEVVVSMAASGTGKTKFLEQPSLEELLVELLQYGQPRVGVYGSDCKWSCSVEMNTNTVGADFKCRSEHNHSTPTEAARVCLERVLKAVEQYRK
jgi:hypothetical protein